MNRCLFVLALAAAALTAASSTFGAEGDPIFFTPPADTPAGGSGFVGALQVSTNGVSTINNQDDARAALLSAANRATQTPAVINYGPNDGHFFAAPEGGNIPNNPGFPNGGDNIAAVYRGSVNIPTPGVYTFGVNSDDGFTLAFPGRSFDMVTQANGAALQTYNGQANGAFQYYAGRGNNDSLAAITLPAGPVPVVLTFHNGNGGRGVEFFAAAGSKAGFDATFNLVGGPAITAQAAVMSTRYTGMTTGLWTVKNYDQTGLNLGNGQNAVNNVITRFNANETPQATGTYQTVRLSDPQGGGNNHGNTVAFPNDTPANDDMFGTAATVGLTIGAGRGGHYTFDILADDSSLFRIKDSVGNFVTIISTSGGAGNGPIDSNGDTVNDAFGTTGCCADALGTYDLAAGNYTIEAFHQEGAGGASFGVFGAIGDKTAFDASFQAVGENLDDTTITQQARLARDAGLQWTVETPEPASVGVLAFAILGLLGRRRTPR